MSATENVIQFLCDHDLTVATAESVTAGLIASLLADVSGCGQTLEGGYIVYSKTAKRNYLGVDPAVMETFGLTSEPVAREMIEGLASRSGATFYIAVTGTAESDDELNGVVCFGYGCKFNGQLKIISETKHFDGERNEVRVAAAHYALENIPTVYQKLLHTN
jgi:nicotinamide-nucleotide amidase